MKEWYKIAGFLLLLLVLTAEDCSDEAHQPSFAESQMTVYDEIENDFIADEIDPATLKAFEERALEKMYEFIDYMNLYADSSLNAEFRLQARQMAVALFVDKADFNKLLENLQVVEEEPKNRLIQNDGKSVEFKLENVQVINSLQSVDSNYIGQLFYRINDTDQNIDLRLQKTEIAFGNDEMAVWKIFFKL